MGYMVRRFAGKSNSDLVNLDWPRTELHAAAPPSATVARLPGKPGSCGREPAYFAGRFAFRTTLLADLP